VTRRRGIVAVLAMARPARSASEVAAVAAALATFPAAMSLRRKAQMLAQRVVAELMADSDSDALDQALRALHVSLSHDPVLILATHPDIDLAGELAQERIARFEARGCRQISEDAWNSETDEIVAALRRRLSARFRRREKMAVN